MPRGQAEKALEAHVAMAFSTVAGSCLSRHPELEPYISEWIAQARRTVIICSPKSKSELNFLAHAFYAPYSLDFSVPLAVTRDLDLPQGALTPLAPAFKPVVEYSRDAIVRAAQAGGATRTPLELDALDTFVHEILHSTHGNSHLDHNTLQTTRFNPKKPCATSVFDDRVNILSALCSGYSNAFKRDLYAGLFERISHCGIERGCASTFTGDLESRSFLEWIRSHYSPSRPLEPRAAHSLCTDIHRKGYCHSVIEKAPQIVLEKAYLKDPAFKKVTDELLLTLEDLLPRARNDLPRALFAHQPHFLAGLDSLSHTRCFETAFYAPQPGATAFYLKTSPAESLGTQRDLRVTALAVADRMPHARTALENSEACKSDPITQKALLEILQGHEEHWQELGARATFQDLLGRRFVGKPEQLFRAWKDHAFRWEDPLWSQLLGAQRLQAYFVALSRYHGESGDFDCDALPLPK